MRSLSTPQSVQNGWILLARLLSRSHSVVYPRCRLGTRPGSCGGLQSSQRDWFLVGVPHPRHGLGSRIVLFVSYSHPCLGSLGGASLPGLSIRRAVPNKSMK